MRRLALLALLVLVFSGAASGRGDDSWRREVAGQLSFLLPPGWRLTEAGGGAVAATSFAGWPRRRLPRDAAVVLVYAPQRTAFARFHRRLELADGEIVRLPHSRLRATEFRFRRAQHGLRIAVAFTGRRGEAMQVVNAVWPWPPHVRVRWRASRSAGVPHSGSLSGGVQLPEHGLRFFTWDPLLRTQPDRPGRRWGHERLVRLVLRVMRAYAQAHPDAPRLGIGDLSRPNGGWFGPRHVSHQNGLDVDIFFPRTDRRERPPDRPDQIDRVLAQDLVDRFVRAGATKVFVGPRTGLRGPPEIVQVLSGHDNHLHVRIPK